MANQCRTLVCGHTGAGCALLVCWLSEGGDAGVWLVNSSTAWWCTLPHPTSNKMVYIKCQTLFWNLECKSTILPVAHSDIMSLLLPPSINENSQSRLLLSWRPPKRYNERCGRYIVLIVWIGAVLGIAQRS